MNIILRKDDKRILESYLSLFNNDLNKYLSSSDKELILYHIKHQEEINVKYRDQWENWEASFSDFDTTKPFLDLFILEKLKQFNLPGKKLWPEGKKFAFCITHDLDHIGLNRFQESQRFHFRKLPASIYRLARKGTDLVSRILPDHPLWCYEKWLDFIDSCGFKSTFFIYSNPADLKQRHVFDNQFEFDDIIRFEGKLMTVAKMIQRIEERGYEIGLHGSYFSALNSQMLEEQKMTLERILKGKVVATRQHFLRFDIVRTPEVHFCSELTVDSSLGFNKSIGFRAGTCMPYILKTDGTNDLIEIPMNIMDGALFTKNALELDEEIAVKKSLKIMDYCEKIGGVMTINFHPNYITNELWWNVFKRIVLEAKSRNAYNGSFSQVAKICLEHAS